MKVGLFVGAIKSFFSFLHNFFFPFHNSLTIRRLRRSSRRPAATSTTTSSSLPRTSSTTTRSRPAGLLSGPSSVARYLYLSISIYLSIYVYLYIYLNRPSGLSVGLSSEAGIYLSIFLPIYPFFYSIYSTNASIYLILHLFSFISNF